MNWDDEEDSLEVSEMDIGGTRTILTNSSFTEEVENEIHHRV